MEKHSKKAPTDISSIDDICEFGKVFDKNKVYCIIASFDCTRYNDYKNCAFRDKGLKQNYKNGRG